MSAFGMLDDRLLKAVARLGWAEPTAIQQHVIPEALRGKDILCRGRTGSGKTAAYCLPMLHGILQNKKASALTSGVRGVVLLPTRELAQQSARCLRELAIFCSKAVRIMDLSDDNVSKHTISAQAPDIIVSTPARLLSHIKDKTLFIKESVTHLVIDEADLVFSYGYEDDITTLLHHMPKIFQTMLMSATLNVEVDKLKQLVLRNPAIIKLEESDLPDEDQLAQHIIRCELDDKFLIVYALLKLKLLTGKTIIFVNDVDRCYKLKLFLEQFSIKSCVLNSELPLNSRYHIVQQFNKGLYDYIIASDEAVKEASETKKGASKKGKQDREYGVSRGIDFQDVRNVLNFDFPTTPESYVHRVGRTARGHNAGVALSLICHLDKRALRQTTELLEENALQPYAFKMEAIEGLRYRAKDALKAVTRAAIREARRKELQDEIVNSEKLKAHFEDNPRDLEVLRHDKNLLHPARIHAHMRHIPSYLLPKGISEEAVTADMLPNEDRKRKKNHRHTGPNPKRQKLQQNPLKSFQSSLLSAS